MFWKKNKLKVANASDGQRQALAIRIGYCIGFTILMDIGLPNIYRPHCGKRQYNTIHYNTIFFSLSPFSLTFIYSLSIHLCFFPNTHFPNTHSLIVFLTFLPHCSLLLVPSPIITHSHSLSLFSFMSSCFLSLFSLLTI